MSNIVFRRPLVCMTRCHWVQRKKEKKTSHESRIVYQGIIGFEKLAAFRKYPLIRTLFQGILHITYRNSPTENESVILICPDSQRFRKAIFFKAVLFNRFLGIIATYQLLQHLDCGHEIKLDFVYRFNLFLLICRWNEFLLKGGDKINWM